MPNWCNNSITIKGSTETLEPLKKVVTAGEGLLEAMVPMPKQLRDTVKGTGDELQTEVYDGATNWYDWAVSRWGTKWDPEVHLEYKDNGDGTAEITGWFDTAWAPPIEAYNTFCEDMDGVYLEAFYEESGMCFVGCWDSEGGDDYYEYGDATSKTIRDIVPSYLVDEFNLDERLAEYEEEEAEEENVQA